MAHTEFGVTYDGPALAGGTMDVRDLAPALLALGDLFVAAGRTVQKDAEPPSLQIKATTHGSFLVDLALHAGGAWDYLRGMLSSESVNALTNLLDIVIGASGLFALLKALRNRKIASVEPLQPGWVRITVEGDRTTFEGPAEVLQLLQSADVRRATARVVAPLKRSGVESVEFRTDSTPTVTISAADVDAYEVPDIPDEVLLQETQERYVSIASVAFIDGNKWRLSDGNQTFHAALVDEDFRSRVDRGIEAFRAGDMLHCRIRTVQTKRQFGLHTEHEIVQVIRHIPRDVQLSIGDVIDPTAPPTDPER